MNALHRIAAVARVEMMRLLHLRIAFTLLLLVPAMQVLLFGYAIRPTAASVGVVIAAPTERAAAVIAASLRSLPGLSVAAERLKPGEAEALVRKAAAQIGIEGPAGNGRPLRIIVDGANPALTAAAVPRIEAAYWKTLSERTGMDKLGPGLQIERLYNPASRADWTFLPSLIGVTTMISMIMLGTLSLAREREGGTWETLLILPIGPAEALAGKLLPYAAIGTLQGMLVLIAGIVLFELPVRGSIGALVAILPLFVTAHLVLGYAIAARAATQLAALQGAVAFYLPAMLLSGFLYPFQTLPSWAQVMGSVFPLTHFIRAAQGALLRGSGTIEVLAHGLPILGFLLAGLAIALASHARRLD